MVDGPLTDKSPQVSGLARKGPLANLRVVEMGQLLAGPFCAQLLGDFGAEVIKCEPPGTGDPMREWGATKAKGRALWWPVLARNKKSVTLDLRKLEGQEVARRLIAKSDILIENFRPGTLERWELGYEQLASLNPGLIMVRVTGFGQTGPYAQQAGYGSIGEAMGGLRYVVGDPSNPPSRMGISLGDSLAGTFAAFGALIAVHYRSQTGRGQIVDSAISECVLAMMESLITDYQQAGYIRERTGAILPKVAPSNVYPTADGQMVLIAANQDTVFRRLAEAMGRTALAQDPRYSTHAARGDNQQQLDDLISAWTQTLGARELLDLMSTHAVPAGQMYRAPEILADPHFRARRAIVEVSDSIFGTLAMQNVVPRFSESPGEIRHTGPELGAHNHEVYKGLLGLDDEEIRRLAGNGVI